MKLDQ